MTDQSQAAISLQDEQRRQLEQLIQGALLGPAPKFYINGFGFAQTPSDLSMILQLHNQAVGVVNMSYPTAKSLLVDLTNILERYEKSTGETLKTLAELNAKMATTMEDKAESQPTSQKPRRRKL
jgi:hypothetical protein